MSGTRGSHIRGRIGAGALSGVLATGAMSVFMMAARRAGWLGSPPPKKLTDRLARIAGRRPSGASWSMAAVNHLAFGAAAGVPFALLAGRLRTPPGRVALGGLYGAAIWSAMYQGLLPALGLMAAPRWDRPGRPASMAIAHLIYGGVLGALARGDGLYLARTSTART